MFDYSAILAYKTLFFANRAKNTVQQTKEGKKCTAATNAMRCTITASQAVVPLFAVSECLTHTAKENSTISNTAKKLTKSRLKDIAMNVTASNRKGAMRSLSKMGIAGNIAYALGKCADASQDDKTSIFGEAFGNTGGMYLFEHCYSKVIDKVTAEEVAKNISTTRQILEKIPALKNVKFMSLLLGAGFVAASLTGCSFGEFVGKTLGASK